jgi:hypothetical protein
MPQTKTSPCRAKEPRKPKENGNYIAVFPEMRLYVEAVNFEDFAMQIMLYEWNGTNDPTHTISPEYGKLPYVATLYHYCFAIGRISESELVKQLKTLED